MIILAILTALCTGATAAAITYGYPLLAGILGTCAAAWFCTFILNLHAGLLEGIAKTMSK
jgi:hypothetical protein